MKSDQEKWNSKFASRTHLLSPEPFLLRHLAVTPGQTLLDLACGDGRNAIHYARSGAIVTAADLSDVGLAKLQAHAQAEDLAIQTSHANFDNLDFFERLNNYDSVVINHFKPSFSLWQKVHKLLRKGGRLYLCAFNKRQNEHFDFPIEYCLDEREFFSANPALICERYESFAEEEKFLDGYVFALARG